MADDGSKITIRVSDEDIQSMEDFMAANGIETRSDFIRNAIRCYIANSKASGQVVDENSVLVHLNPVVLQTLDNMRKEGVIFDAESYIRELIVSDVIPQDALTSSKARAFSAAQQNNEDL